MRTTYKWVFTSGNKIGGTLRNLKMAKPNLIIQEELKKIGAKLRRLRIEKGYTNYETFAFTHNISRAQYGRYEQGQDLRLSSLLKVLKALEVTPEVFFKDD